MSRFTDEQYNTAELKAEGVTADDDITMCDIKFWAQHDHENNNLVLGQRYESTVITEDSVSETKPVQHSIIIPAPMLNSIADILMEAAICLSREADEHE